MTRPILQMALLLDYRSGYSLPNFKDTLESQVMFPLRTEEAPSLQGSLQEKGKSETKETSSHVSLKILTLGIA